MKNIVVSESSEDISNITRHYIAFRNLLKRLVPTDAYIMHWEAVNPKSLSILLEPL